MREIPLTHGYVALVDDDDYESVNQFKWYAWTRYRNGLLQVYAIRTVQKNYTKHTVYMHHAILPLIDGHITDHISQNTLDNTRGNLRYATPGQSNANRRSWGMWSDYKGVYPHLNKWRAGININGRMRHLGVFKTQEEAALAYNKAALEQHGEFARLNDIS